MAKIKIRKNIVMPIIYVVILLAIAFAIFFVVNNKDAIWGKVVDNTTIYTQEQLDQEKDKAYNQGYNDAHTNNAELNQQIEQYLNTITAKNNELAEKQTTIDQNNQTIAQNQVEIERLENELTNTNQNNTQTIQELQTQINSLQLQNQTLQNDNATNLSSIIELNKEITGLEEQITNLSNQIAENEKKVAEYEANKNAWLNSIAYYEQFVQALETETQAVAIFEVKGTVYNAQIVTKGTSANVTNPTDTETQSFVGWYVDDVLIEDINTYPITTNTKFVAKFNITYSVKFMLDNETEFTTIKVTKGNYPTELETLPSKDGYDLDGFTINGVDIVIYTEYPITQNTTFIAKFTKVHTVTYFADNQIVKTQQVRNGEYIGSAEDITTSFAKDGYDFDGLTLNNVDFIDYTNYPILANTIFNIKYTKVHTVIIMSNNEVAETLQVRNGEYAHSNIQNVLFWTIGEDEINLEEYSITQDITINANYDYSPYGNWEIEFCSFDSEGKVIYKTKICFTYSNDNLDYVVYKIGTSVTNLGKYVETSLVNGSQININNVNNLGIKVGYLYAAYVNLVIIGDLNFNTKTNLWTFTNIDSKTMNSLTNTVIVQVNNLSIFTQAKIKVTDIETTSLIQTLYNLTTPTQLDNKYKMVA